VTPSQSTSFTTEGCRFIHDSFRYQPFLFLLTLQLHQQSFCMKLQAGLFLKSTDALNETVFEKTVIYLTEYNERGAIGFVINKPFDRPLNALEEFRHSPAFPLYDGGPVDREHLFFLHRRDDLIHGGTPAGGTIYSGGDFSQAVRHINNNSLTASDIKLFIGYCGWDARELEAELEEGSWTITDGSAETVFS
jgi:putative transcriptional regulator